MATKVKQSLPYDKRSELLRVIPLFKEVRKGYLMKIPLMLMMHNYEKGETVYREGQACESFIIVIKGRFSILKTSVEGREKVVAELRVGQHFGLAEIITGQRWNATIEAAEAGVVLTMSKEHLTQTLLDNPETSLHVIKTMATTIMNLSNQIQQVSFERVSVRLARLLMQLAVLEGREMGSRTVIGRAHSHQDLARRLGASRETVTRMLKNFRQLGLVTTERRQLVVQDSPGLKHVVERGGLENEPE